MEGFPYHGPSEARLNNLADREGAGIWNPSTENTNEYIQVRLLKRASV